MSDLYGEQTIRELREKLAAALARAERADLTAKLAFKACGDADNSAARLSDAYELLEARAEKAEAALATARKALRLVEYAGPSMHCPNAFCGVPNLADHAPGCPIGITLAAPVPIPGLPDRPMTREERALARERISPTPRFDEAQSEAPGVFDAKGGKATSWLIRRDLPVAPSPADPPPLTMKRPCSNCGVREADEYFTFCGECWAAYPLTPEKP